MLSPEHHIVRRWVTSSRKVFETRKYIRRRLTIQDALLLMLFEISHRSESSA